MSIKLSHSGVELHSLCPRKYYLQNIEKILPISKSSALYQGVAFDLCFNEILLNHGKLDNEELISLGLAVFHKNWLNQEDRYQGMITLPHNSSILYTKKDYEEGILTEADSEAIEGYFQDILPELKDDTFESGYELFHHLRELHKTFEYWDESSKSFYNFVNWISVKRKAPLIIRAYVEELLPQIEKVLSIQQDLSTVSQDGDIFSGISDFVAVLKNTNGAVTICDNKSSSKLYAEDSVRTSSQLSKYKHILNHEHNMNVTKGAYFVFLKELKQIKNKTCKSCGYKTTGLSKTCDNKIEKKRCGGEYEVEVTYKAQTQLVVDDIPEDTERVSMEQVDDTILKIRSGNFEPDITKCDFQFGARCAYYLYCHENRMDGLIKVEKKK